MSTVSWHLDYLDSLRSIAVLGVVLIHSHMMLGYTIPLSPVLAAIIDSGGYGVGLFFIVSAFTLFLSHDNRKDEASPTRSFFIRRFFRLAPMLYIAILLEHILLPRYGGGSKEMLLAALFIGGLHPTTIHAGALGGWSVADEALFYLCLPLLFWAIKSLKAALVWLTISLPIAFVVSHLLARAYPQYDGYGYFRLFWFVGQFPIFLMGIVAYFIWKRSSKDNKGASLALLAGVGVCYVLLLPFTARNFYQVGLVYAILLLSVALHPWRILVNPVTRFLGRISYSIYLLHFYPCYLLHRWNVSFPVVVIGTLWVSIPAAYLTWKFIEEPGIALGRRVIKRSESKSMREIECLTTQEF